MNMNDLFRNQTKGHIRDISVKFLGQKWSIVHCSSIVMDDAPLAQKSLLNHTFSAGQSCKLMSPTSCVKLSIVWIPI